MSENSLRTNRGYLLAAVVMCPLLPSSAVAQSDVSRLLEDTRGDGYSVEPVCRANGNLYQVKSELAEPCGPD